jgi:hypothetical protein
LRKLGANARPSQQAQSLATVTQLCHEGDADSWAAIASAGAIPPLVQLLRVDSPADVLKNATASLGMLAENGENAGIAAAIAAGAIPRLVLLLGEAGS